MKENFMSHTTENNERKSKKSLIVILFLLLLIVALAAVCVWAIFFRGPSDSDILPPDYAPMDTDSNATDIEGDTTDKLDAPEGGGAVGLTYSDTVTVDLSDKTVTLMFQNPGRSLNNMVLQIVVQDTLLAQSDLLVPGKQILKMPLKEEAASKLKAGGYNGKFVVSIYNPETGEKNMIDAEVEITVNVTE